MNTAARQKVCWAVPVLNVYVLSASVPRSSVKRSWHDECRFAFLRHMSQLHYTAS